MDSAFVNDGYTRRGRIEGKPGGYPSIEFTWREHGAVRHGEYTDALRRGQTSAQRNRIIAELMAAEILEWNLQDGNCAVVPITAESILRLKYPLFEKLGAIIIVGNDQPDVDLSAEWAVAVVAADQQGVSLREHMQGN